MCEKDVSENPLLIRWGEGISRRRVCRHHAILFPRPIGWGEGYGEGVSGVCFPKAGASWQSHAKDFARSTGHEGD